MILRAVVLVATLAALGGCQDAARAPSRSSIRYDAEGRVSPIPVPPVAKSHLCSGSVRRTYETLRSEADAAKQANDMAALRQALFFLDSMVDGDAFGCISDDDRAAIKREVELYAATPSPSGG